MRVRRLPSPPVPQQNPPTHPPTRPPAHPLLTRLLRIEGSVLALQDQLQQPRL